MTTSTDELALLATCRRTPLDTTARLVYADYLAEQGREGEAIALRIATEPEEDRHRLNWATWLQFTSRQTRCSLLILERDAAQGIPFAHLISCPECKGRSTVPDPVAMARAELVRVQCELAAARKAGWSYGSDDDRQTCHCENCKLLSHERDIFTAHASDFRRGPKCKDCNGTGTYQEEGPVHGDRCVACHGTGDAGGLMRQHTIEERHDAGLLTGEERYHHRVEWVRGMPVVDCTLGECVAKVEEDVPCPRCEEGSPCPETNVIECRHCDSTGVIDTATHTVPSHWLLAVVRSHPGVTFRVTDRGPYHNSAGKYLFDKGRFPGRADTAVIPIPIYDLLTGYEFDLMHASWRLYPTSDAADASLGRSLWLWSWLHISPHSP